VQHYDLIVIGSGPAGEKGAAQAAYFGKRVAIVERSARVGGTGINTGTVQGFASAGYTVLTIRSRRTCPLQTLCTASIL